MSKSVNVEAGGRPRGRLANSAVLMRTLSVACTALTVAAACAGWFGPHTWFAYAAACVFAGGGAAVGTHLRAVELRRRAGRDARVVRWMSELPRRTGDGVG